MSELKQLNIRIAEETIEELKKVSKKEERSLSQMLRYIIQNYLRQYTK
jgi:predicted DNA-binding protein